MTLVLSGVALAGTGALLIVQPGAADDMTSMAATVGSPASGTGGAGAERAPDSSTDDQRVPVAPVSLALPGLDDFRQVPITPVDVGPNGALGVPEDPQVLGWWKSGAGTTDRIGSIVIDGHLDSAEHGLGFFVNLRQLVPGDTVTVRDARGVSTSWRVSSAQRYNATELPTEQVFGRDSSVRLVLITCAGPYDRRAKAYRDNLVVYAEPEPVVPRPLSDAAELYGISNRGQTGQPGEPQERRRRG